MLQNLTKESVKKELNTRGLGAVFNTAQLQEALGTVSMRMLRMRMEKGELKVHKKSGKYNVLSIEDAAEFLLRYPEYLTRKNTPIDMNLDETTYNELIDRIRKHIMTSWRGLMKRVDIDDLVSECLIKYLHQNANCKVSETTRLYRIMANIYQREKNKPILVGYEIPELDRIANSTKNEETATGDEND